MKLQCTAKKNTLQWARTFSLAELNSKTHKKLNKKINEGMDEQNRGNVLKKKNIYDAKPQTTPGKYKNNVESKTHKSPKTHPTETCSVDS